MKWIGSTLSLNFETHSLMWLLLTRSKLCAKLVVETLLVICLLSYLSTVHCIRREQKLSIKSYCMPHVRKRRNRNTFLCMLVIIYLGCANNSNIYGYILWIIRTAISPYCINKLSTEIIAYVYYVWILTNETTINIKYSLANYTLYILIDTLSVLYLENLVLSHHYYWSRMNDCCVRILYTWERNYVKCCKTL